MSPEELLTCRNLLELLQDENGEVAQYWQMMLEHINSQARKIEALKEDLLTDRSDLILYSPEFSVWRYQHNVNDIREQDDWTPIKTEARRQLAAEHPDLFCEPTKMMADSEKEARP
jgi:hypothetical protein